MGYRRLYYTRPLLLENFLPKQAESIIDFGQLDRKSGYYRRRSDLGKYILPVLIMCLFLSLFVVSGYYSIAPVAHYADLPFPTKNFPVSPQPTAVAKKVVESVSVSNEEKTYSYTVQSGDSYAKLVKRAVKEFAVANDLSLSNSELNTAVYTIVSELDREPLHPGDMFLLSKKTINDVLLPIYP